MRQHRAKFKLARVFSTNPLDHHVRVVQWRLLDPPGSNGFTEILEGYYNVIAIWTKLESEKVRQDSTGSQYFWYPSKMAEGDGVLMRVEGDGATTGPFYIKLTAEKLRMSQ